MPTWLTGALVNVRMVRSATVRPRNSHTSPVRVCSAARASGIGARRAGSSARGTEGALRVRPIWKLVGLAGIAGVAATGVAVVRAERRRAAYAPDQVRDRLHERYKRADPGGTGADRGA